jgi:hypothetical protein
MRYELCYKDVVKKSDDIVELQDLAKHLSCHWEIFRIVESRVSGVIMEMEKFGTGGVEGMINDLKKGVPMCRLAKKYHVSPPTISKYITLYKNKHETVI